MSMKRAHSDRHSCAGDVDGVKERKTHDSSLTMLLNALKNCALFMLQLFDESVQGATFLTIQRIQRCEHMTDHFILDIDSVK